MRAPVLRIHKDELIVDNFAGGGGASVGISWALGRDPDIAINHNAEAIAMHKANHPNTKHYVCDVFEVDPLEACGLTRPWSEIETRNGRFRVGLAWFSPDCTFHSKARGAKPFRDRNQARRRRGLAGVVLKWAAQVRPRVIALENVEEFQDWGPLDDDGKPDPSKKGSSFRRWVARLENLGYDVEWRELNAADYGAHTSRVRLFVLARCDGQPNVWPEATHGPGLQPYRTAAQCIDWQIPCPSIFMTREEAKKFKDETGITVQRPLSAKTMRRIAAGLKRYVLDSADPFIVPVNHGSGGFDGDGLGRSHSIDEPINTITAQRRGSFAMVSPVLIQTSWGERKGQRPRYLNIHEPVGTIMAGGIKHSVVEARLERVAAFIAKHFGGENANGTPKAGPGTDPRAPIGTVTTQDHNYVITTHLVNLKGSMEARQSSSQGVDEPSPTITAGGNHVAEVRAFLLKYYGTDQDPRLSEPMHTLTTKDRMALVTVTIKGEEYFIADIGMRMLTPRELFLAQGFPAEYIIDPVVDTEVKRGKRTQRVRKALTKTSQVHMCGNSVCPPAAEALLVPNFAQCVDRDFEQAA